MGIKKDFFGNMPDGRHAFLFTLSNSNGVTVQVTNYGAKLVSAYVPDRKGKIENVVFGYNNLDHYIKGHPYLGATIGRVANRIGDAKFELGGHVYNLEKNHGDNHLHGGTVAFDSLLWDITQNSESNDIPSVEFQLMSPDGDHGYPGEVLAKVKYALLDNNSIRIDFSATTNRPTIINMTNHAYFNLNIDNSDNIYQHRAQFNASNYLETDMNSVPTGRLLNVKNTPLDFIQRKEIGLEINKQVEPIMNTKGYDQFFVTDNYKQGELSKMAEVEEPNSGRVLQVFSTLPGMQFYTGNFLDTIFPIKNNKIHGKHSSFCIEPSYFPDAPNHENFSRILINVDESYNETIVYKFITE